MYGMRKLIMTIRIVNKNRKRDQYYKLFGVSAYLSVGRMCDDDDDDDAGRWW